VPEYSFCLSGDEILIYLCLQGIKFLVGVNISRFRKKILIVLLVLIPLGFLTKIYKGPFQEWCHYYSGGILYEIFWCLMVAFVGSKISKLRIALGVLGVTCCLEFLQLYHHPVLENIRSTFLGKTLIGHSFSWLDFPYYFIGCGLGYIILIKLDK